MSSSCRSVNLRLLQSSRLPTSWRSLGGDVCSWWMLTRTNLALLQEVVHHLGHDADGSSSAQQALQKIADRDYDLIITDMHLPGMDGLYLYQRLRELRPELAQRVIFISGRLLSDEVGAFLGRVGCPLIRKPFSVADIEMGMRQALEVSAIAVPDPLTHP